MGGAPVLSEVAAFFELNESLFNCMVTLGNLPKLGKWYPSGRSRDYQRIEPRIPGHTKRLYVITAFT